MNYKLRYSQYNECAILIEWPSLIDENILKSILKFKNKLLNRYIKQKVEVIHTYNSILVIYDTTIENINGKFQELKTLFESQDTDHKLSPRLWEIPVCYSDEFGPDLEHFLRAKSLSKAELIVLHTKVVYTVFFIGFLPGFLYLGGLDPKLYFDRKTTPGLHVKKGAVAIGGQQTGIYPQDSPGGWHVIGQTPVELFNKAHNPPCNIQPGDQLKFVAIDQQHYGVIEHQIAEEEFQLKPVSSNA